MNKISMLMTAAAMTLMGQLSFMLGIEAAGIALSAAALPMLLPVAVSALKQRRRKGFCQVSYAA